MAENTSGGSGGQAPIGAEKAGGTGASGAGGSLGVNNPNLGAGGAGGGSSVIELSEDSMVKLPGAKDPVRYGDHYKSFQSEFTKRAQETAGLRKEVAASKQREADYQRRLQQGQQGQQQRVSKLQELAGQLKSLTYLNGEQAASVVDHVMNEIGGLSKELSRRDMALALMYKQMKQMGTTLDRLHSNHTNTEFDSKIAKFVKEGGLPEKATSWAKKLYLAYEGDDLDQEFPKILKTEWEEIGGVFKTSEREKVEAARRAPFVPGKGGNGSPSRPLGQDWVKKSAKDIADAVWPGMVDGAVET